MLLFSRAKKKRRDVYEGFKVKEKGVERVVVVDTL